MDDWLSVLQNEFEAGDGSLLIKIRCGLAWDTIAYNRMTAAMEACCRAKRGDIQVTAGLRKAFGICRGSLRTGQRIQTFLGGDPMSITKQLTSILMAWLTGSSWTTQHGTTLGYRLVENLAA